MTEADEAVQKILNLLGSRFEQIQGKLDDIGQKLASIEANLGRQGRYLDELADYVQDQTQGWNDLGTLTYEDGQAVFKNPEG